MEKSISGTNLHAEPVFERSEYFFCGFIGFLDCQRMVGGAESH